MPKDKRSGEYRISPYNKFMKSELARVKSEHPDLSHRDAFKQAANNWKNSPDNPKYEPRGPEAQHSMDRSSPSAEPPRAAVATSHHHHPHEAAHAMASREKEQHARGEEEEQEPMQQTSQEPTPSKMTHPSNTAQVRETPIVAVQPSKHETTMQMPAMSSATGEVGGGNAGGVNNNSSNGSSDMSHLYQQQPHSSSDRNHKEHEHNDNDRESIMQSAALPLNPDISANLSYGFQSTQHHQGF